MLSAGLFMRTDLLACIAVTEEAFLIPMSSFFSWYTSYCVFQGFWLINLGSFEMMPLRAALITHLHLQSSAPGPM